MLLRWATWSVNNAGSFSLVLNQLVANWDSVWQVVRANPNLWRFFSDSSRILDRLCETISGIYVFIRCAIRIQLGFSLPVWGFTTIWDPVRFLALHSNSVVNVLLFCDIYWLFEKLRDLISFLWLLIITIWSWFSLLSFIATMIQNVSGIYFPRHHSIYVVKVITNRNQRFEMLTHLSVAIVETT